MATEKLVVDSNIFIDYLRAGKKQKTILFSIQNDSTIFVSAVTLYELYMGATSEEKKNDIRKLTKGLAVLPFNDDVAEEAALIYHDLRTSNQMIEFRDIFIAATCIVYDLPLKTTNNKHFKRIKKLRFS